MWQVSSFLLLLRLSLSLDILIIMCPCVDLFELILLEFGELFVVYSRIFHPTWEVLAINLSALSLVFFFWDAYNVHVGLLSGVS